MAKIRQADVLIDQGKSVPEVCKQIEVREQTYYRWRQKYGGMSPDMIKQFRALQKENARLRLAFRATRTMREYSHNRWYIIRGQVTTTNYFMESNYA